MPRVLIALFLIAGWLLGGVAQVRPAAGIPASAAEVLETLPRGYSLLMPRQRPASPPRATRVADATVPLSVAARTGDARLARRADAILSTVPAGDATPAVPRARFARAQVQLVRGRVDRARAESASRARRPEADRLFLAALAMAPGDVRTLSEG